MASSSSAEANADYTDAILKRSAAKIIMSVGFSGATNVTLDYTADLLERYMSKMMTEAKHAAEINGRSKATITDVDHVFKKMNISFMELHDYIQQVRPFPLPVKVPAFPVEHEKILDSESPNEEELAERSTCYDKFLPTLYPQIKSLDLTPELNNSNTSTSEASIPEATSEDLPAKEEEPEKPEKPELEERSVTPPPLPPEVNAVAKTPKACVQTEKQSVFPTFAGMMVRDLGLKIRTKEMMEEEKKAMTTKKHGKSKKSKKEAFLDAPTIGDTGVSLKVSHSAADMRKNPSPLPKPSHSFSDRHSATPNSDITKHRASASSTTTSRPDSAPADPPVRSIHEKLLALSKTALKQSTEVLNARKVGRPPHSQSHSFSSPHLPEGSFVKKKSREDKKSKEEKKKKELEKIPSKNEGSGEHRSSVFSSGKNETPKQESHDMRPLAIFSTPLSAPPSLPIASSTPIGDLHATPFLPATESKLKKKKSKKEGREDKTRSHETQKTKLDLSQASSSFALNVTRRPSVLSSTSTTILPAGAPDLNDDCTNTISFGGESTLNDTQTTVASNLLTSVSQLDMSTPFGHDSSHSKPHKAKKKKEKREKEHKEKKRDKEHKKDKKKSHKERKRSRSPGSSKHRPSDKPELKLKIRIGIGPSSGSSVAPSPMQSPPNPFERTPLPPPLPTPVEELVPVSPDDDDNLPIRFLTETPKTSNLNKTVNQTPSADAPSKTTEKRLSYQTPAEESTEKHHRSSTGNEEKRKPSSEEKQKAEEKKKRLEEKKKKKEKRMEMERHHEHDKERTRQPPLELPKMVTDKFKSEEKHTDKVRLEEKTSKRERKEGTVRSEHSSRPETPKMRDGEKHIKKSKSGSLHHGSLSRSETPLLSEQRPSSSSSSRTPMKKEKERQKEKDRMREKEKREKEREREKEKEKERREKEREREELERKREAEEAQKSQLAANSDDSDSDDSDMRPIFTLPQTDGYGPIQIDLENVWVCPVCSVAYVEGENMVGCDTCDQWFHWACVGLTEAPPENLNWYCKDCLPAQQKSRKRAQGSAGSKRGAKKRRL
ncbi:hypothetical protein L596_003345 [Steinernema carpocapsae]|uniref:PHD-type domain-containing protein n=1 Tax=Steinernema carpocapsae TaxID=34508 RepID=A0A4U8US13_STECR|nr:hypothetical protein L596_003345 [Steinernema carpocapsae]